LIAELFILIGLAFLSSLLFIAVLLFVGVANLLAWLLLLPLWLIIFVVIVVATLAPLRRWLITRPLWRLGRKIAPKMGDTERQALEAGAVWWDGDLFCGRPDWHKLQVLRFPSLTGEEQAFLDNQVTDLCHRLDDWKIMYEQVDLPEEIWTLLKQERFFGMAIPKAHGGLGFSALMQSTVVSMVATRSLSAAVDRDLQAGPCLTS
jgi:acyl-CoA dehydrogenase